YSAAAGIAAKTSVTEMKRLHVEVPDDAVPWDWGQTGIPQTTFAAKLETESTLRLSRPAFMSEKSITSAEKGSVNHLLMQHAPITDTINEAVLAATLEGMIDRRLLTAAQSLAIDLKSVAAFFHSALGHRLLSAEWVRREVPFSCMFPANRVYPGLDS